MDYVGAGPVVVSCIDVEVWGAADAVGQVGQNCSGGVAAPISVPNVIGVDGRLANYSQERTTVIRNPIAGFGLAVSSMGILVFFLIVVVAQAMDHLRVVG